MSDLTDTTTPATTRTAARMTDGTKVYGSGDTEVRALDGVGVAQAGDGLLEGLEAGWGDVAGGDVGAGLGEGLGVASTHGLGGLLATVDAATLVVANASLLVRAVTACFTGTGCDLVGALQQTLL